MTTITKTINRQLLTQEDNGVIIIIEREPYIPTGHTRRKWGEQRVGVLSSEFIKLLPLLLKREIAAEVRRIDGAKGGRPRLDDPATEAERSALRLRVAKSRNKSKKHIDNCATFSSGEVVCSCDKHCACWCHKQDGFLRSVQPL